MLSNKSTHTQNDIVQKYAKLYPEYIKLGKEIKAQLKFLLNKERIEFIEITERAKNVTAFKRKIERKTYRDPLTEVRDLCAIRVICSFPGELRKIEEVIRKNFKVSAYHNQEKNISPYKFWYRSHHFEIELNKKQLTHEYILLKQCIAEIQVRTVFMNSWAIMEHKINYKHEWNTSLETKRKLSRLSALLELADEQLEELSKKS